MRIAKPLPKLMSTLAACLGLMVAASAGAQGFRDRPSYEVEVVIFAYTSAAAGDEELWPERLLVPRLNGVLELLPPPMRTDQGRNREPRQARPLTDDVGTRLSAIAPGVVTDAFSAGPDPAGEFELLDPAAYRLREEADRIDRSGRYRVLWHKAWRQPGLGPEEALAVHVRAGDPVELSLVDLTASLDLETLMANLAMFELPGPFGETALLDRLTGIELPSALPVPPDPSRIRIYPLDGSLRLEMSRYLHIYTDLVLTEPVRILSANRRRGTSLGTNRVEALQSYPVQSHRRMRSGEMHHLDHPLLGVLLLTTRIEAPEQPEPDDSEPVDDR